MFILFTYFLCCVYCGDSATLIDIQLFISSLPFHCPPHLNVQRVWRDPVLLNLTSIKVIVVLVGIVHKLLKYAVSGLYRNNPLIFIISMSVCPRFRNIHFSERSSRRFWKCRDGNGQLDHLWNYISTR